MNFQTLSKAGLGSALVVILNAVFPIIGIEVPEGSVAATMEAIGQVIGFGLLIWGQIDRKDLIGGIVRR